MNHPIDQWTPDLSPEIGPKFRALAMALREGARSGALPPGMRLPPIRDMAWKLRVTTGTVARAYQLAAAEGVIESHVGRGSFIAAARNRRPAPQPLLYESLDSPVRPDGPVDLRIPHLPDCGQAAIIGAHLAGLGAGLDVDILDYTPLSRDIRCRRAVLDWLADRPLGPALPEDLVLTHGGQHALLLVMALAMTDQSDGVMVETLTYPGMRHAAGLARARIHPVAMDEEGITPQALDRVARDSGARLVCLTPSAQNPTLAGMGRERRAAIIEVARRHDLQILEDECYAPSPGPDAPPSLRALAPERVWFVASLSKIIAAGLRFGMLLCPEGMGRAGRVAAQHSHMGLSQPITGLVTRLLESGDAERIATKVQAQVADRLALAHDCLSPLAAISRPGVPMLWLPLPSPWRAEAFVLRAASAGVFVRPASDFHAAPRMQSTPVEAVRIALNCRLPRDRLAEGLRLVAQLALSDPTQGPA